MNPEVFWNLVYDWLDERGYDYIFYDPKRPSEFDLSKECILSGPSPRGVKYIHAVVGLFRTIIHDPHPDKTGLLGNPLDWKISYLVPK
jgi:hypothetical protein